MAGTPAQGNVIVVGSGPVVEPMPVIIDHHYHHYDYVGGGGSLDAPIAVGTYGGGFEDAPIAVGSGGCDTFDSPCDTQFND